MGARVDAHVDARQRGSDGTNAHLIIALCMGPLIALTMTHPPGKCWPTCHPLLFQDITMSDPIQGDQLKSVVQRIERLEEEKAAIAADIKEVYAEAKANGYDVKILRKVIALRKRDIGERREEETLIDLYLEAVGQKA
jgi:uncharacterized protein (UPF0335 family)